MMSGQKGKKLSKACFGNSPLATRFSRLAKKGDKALQMSNDMQKLQAERIFYLMQAARIQAKSRYDPRAADCLTKARQLGKEIKRLNGKYASLSNLLVQARDASLTVSENRPGYREKLEAARRARQAELAA
jgi:RNase P subunit RPR2